MDIGKSFGQMFKDPQWMKKMLFFTMFVILSIFLIGIPFVAGYMVMTIHNYIKGDENLPEWENNWQDIFVTGLKYLGVIIMFSVIAGIVSFFTTGAVTLLASITSEIDGFEIIAILLLFIQMILSFVINLLFTFINYIVQIRFAKNLSFSDVFDFDWYFPFLKKSWKNLLITLLLTIVTGFIASFGLLALCVGIFFTSFYAVTVNSHLLAQVAIEAGETTVSSSVDSIPASAPTKLESSSSEKEDKE